MNEVVECTGCGKAIATIVTVIVKTEQRLLTDDGPAGWVLVPTEISRRATLAEGLVPRRKRHPTTGLPWYGKSRRLTYAHVTVGPPCVVTCSCGTDSTIAGLADAGRRRAADVPGEDHPADDELVLDLTADDF